ncbi:type IV pilus assembly protein PilM [Lacimicrobium alkaliphilum]|uniref:Pilus assembly protein PilM n=1 Tax=Lacimicrobium alkaliphilum TaxID=1526571 RepID=A0ABQ1RKM0_9ALTE|nr:type IV pilus assembly protein PilM [Lacimicrobium alkaliphilum]GGD73655.1 pilus assembly protein PilM [Lacimicrobium alkaliphilum]
MLNKIFSKKISPVLGLDIGTRYVKAVLLTGSGTDVQVAAVACEAINGDAFADRDIKDFDAVSNAIRKVRNALKVKCKSAAVAVSGASIITKVVYMDPEQSDHELESQIEIEADSLIPYPLDEVYLDFEELGPSQSHTAKVEVLLSAGHKDMIDNRVTLLRELELEPIVIDVEGYALGSALIEYGPSSDEQPVCCINLGASQLLVTAVQGNRVIYSKEHNFGFDNLIRDISLVFAMEWQDAEQQMAEGLLQESWKEQQWPVFMANLQQQLSRALQMYVASTNKVQPKHILISGGGALLPEMAAELEKELSIEVALFDPFANMKMKPEIKQRLGSLAPQLAIAAGLASRSFSPWHI